jgi:hypothetical protein
MQDRNYDEGPNAPQPAAPGVQACMQARWLAGWLAGGRADGREAETTPHARARPR